MTRVIGSLVLVAAITSIGSSKAQAIPAESPATGNHYEYIVSLGISWADARLAAEEILFSFDGTEYSGYLATITTADEAAFVRSLVPELPYPYVWLGASDASYEGEWRWVTGPEGAENSGLGRLFWLGDYVGSPVDGAYTDWNGGEPNNYDPEIGENYLQMIGEPKLWNDNIGTADFITGFLVEWNTAPEPGVFALLVCAGLTLLALRARRAAETPWRPSRPGSRRTSR